MLSKVAIHVACDPERIREVKNKNRFPLDTVQKLNFPQRPSAQEELLESGECRRSICEVIELLPPECRQAFLLSRVRGMTYGQIADHCNISVAMVEKHISHALLVLIKQCYRNGH